MRHARGIGQPKVMLVEREVPLECLHRDLDAACAGQGRAVMLDGAPGVGKTSLLDALAAEASGRELTVLRARGNALERESPFGMLRQLLGAPARRRAATLTGAERLALAPLGVVDDTVESEFAAVHGIFWLLATLAAERPVVALLDDVHWSDPASTRTLGVLAARLAEVPALLVLASWPADGETEHRELWHRVDTTMTLRPLNRSGVAEVLRRGHGVAADEELVEAVHAATAGNPQLVVFVARALQVRAAGGGHGGLGLDAGQVARLAPDGLSAEVMRRARLAGADACALARAITVLPGPVTPWLGAALAGLTLDRALAAADRLRACELLGPDDDLSYVHELVRAAVHEDLPPGERVRLQTRAAHLLHEAGAPAGEVAALLISTPVARDPWNAERFAQAATLAVQAGASGHATELWRRAVAEAPGDPRLLLGLGRSQLATADPEAAATFARTTAATLSPEARAEVAVDQASALRLGMRSAEAVGVLQDALADATIGGDARRLLDAELLVAALFAGDPAPLPVITERGRTPGERALLVAAALTALTELAPVGRARRWLEAGWANGRLLEEVGPAGGPVMSAMSCAVLLDAPVIALDMAETVMVRARERGSVTGYVTALCTRGYAAYRRGDVNAGLADAHEALAVEDDNRTEFFLPFTLAFAVELFMETGQFALADGFLVEHGLAGELPDQYPFNLMRERRGRLRVAMGRIREGLEDLLLSRERLGFIRAPAGGAGAALCLAYAALGRTADGRRYAEEDLVAARAMELPRAEGIALRALALTDDGVDEALLVEAADACGRGDAALERARALTDLGAARRRRGARVQSREPLLEALSLATEGGATVLAARARDELAAAGGRPRRAVRHGVDALTPSERRIVELAASGHANREIAQMLFLTVRTVEMHLTGAYRKLGIDGRAGLADAFKSHGPPT